MKLYTKKAVNAALKAGVFLFIILLLLTQKASYPVFDFSKTGQIGDTIGGITAPFIGVAVAILTFLAFYMQFKANETHNRQFDEQSSEKEREKHENKILYLIKQNRNISDSFSINQERNSSNNEDIEGAKCFAKMFNEYRAAYEIVKSFYNGKIENNKMADSSHKCNI